MGPGFLQKRDDSCHLKQNCPGFRNGVSQALGGFGEYPLMVVTPTQEEAQLAFCFRVTTANEQPASGSPAR